MIRSCANTWKGKSITDPGADSNYCHDVFVPVPAPLSSSWVLRSGGASSKATVTGPIQALFRCVSAGRFSVMTVWNISLVRQYLQSPALIPEA